MPKFYGWLLQGFQDEEKVEEAMVFDRVQAQREIADQDRLGVSRFKVTVLEEGPSAEYTTLEDAMEAFKV